MRISMNLKKKRGGLNERKIWTDIRISMNLKKKDGVLDERKIWTDIRMSMNLKKKKMGFWTNGRLQKTTKKNFLPT